MKYIVYLSIFLLLLSCTNNKEDNLNTRIYPDNPNYENKNLKNGLVKIIRYFPDTKDTFAVYFLNENNLFDSISYFYYRNGHLESVIKYEDSINIRKCKRYYENGNINREFTIYKDSFLLGDNKYYYENGKLRAIQEYVVYNDSIKQLNNQRFYDKSGAIIKDSSFYFEIVTNRDTLSLNDSIKVGFNIIKPKKRRAIAFHGSMDEYFLDKKWADSLILRDSIFYFKPKKLGKNLIEIVFIYFLEPENKLSPYLKIFLKKEVFVTK